MKEDYVSFEVANLLKEKGFNEKCETSYRISNYGCENTANIGDFVKVEPYRESLIPAPTLYMAMKWLREMPELFIEIDYDYYENEGYKYSYTIKTCNSLQRRTNHPKEWLCLKKFDTYEEAVRAGIKECLTNNNIYNY